MKIFANIFQGKLFLNQQLVLYHTNTLSRSVNLMPDTIEAIATGQEIKQFYFGSKPFDKSTEKEMCELMTDFHFSIEHYVNAELLAKFQHK